MRGTLGDGTLLEYRVFYPKSLQFHFNSDWQEKLARTPLFLLRVVLCVPFQQVHFTYQSKLFLYWKKPSYGWYSKFNAGKFRIKSRLKQIAACAACLSTEAGWIETEKKNISRLKKKRLEEGSKLEWVENISIGKSQGIKFRESIATQ